MTEIVLAFALGATVLVLCLHRYWLPILVLGLDPYWFPILAHRYLFSIVAIGSLFGGIAFLFCVTFVCIPEMIAALESYQRQNPHALHAYAMIVGAFSLIGAAYYLWDRHKKNSGPKIWRRLIR